MGKNHFKMVAVDIPFTHWYFPLICGEKVSNTDYEITEDYEIQCSIADPDMYQY